MKTLTINDIFALAKEQIKKGNGKKKIMLSNDDEGNGYHALYFGFTDKARELAFDDYMRPIGVDDSNIDEYIVLG